MTKLRKVEVANITSRTSKAGNVYMALPDGTPVNAPIYGDDVAEGYHIIVRAKRIENNGTAMGDGVLLDGTIVSEGDDLTAGDVWVYRAPKVVPLPSEAVYNALKAVRGSYEFKPSVTKEAYPFEAAEKTDLAADYRHLIALAQTETGDETPF